MIYTAKTRIRLMQSPFNDPLNFNFSNFNFPAPSPSYFSSPLSNPNTNLINNGFVGNTENSFMPTIPSSNILTPSNTDTIRPLTLPSINIDLNSLLRPANNNLNTNSISKTSLSYLDDIIAPLINTNIGNLKLDVLKPIYQAAPNFDALKSMAMMVNPDVKNSLQAANSVQAAVNATSTVGVAVQALAQAIAVCNATIDCNQMEDAFGKTQQLTEITVNAQQKANTYAQIAVDSAGQADKLADNSATPVEKLNVQAAYVSSAAAQSAASQAQVIAQATAAASAQCQVIINVTCVAQVKKKSDYGAILNSCQDFWIKY